MTNTPDDPRLPLPDDRSADSKTPESEPPPLPVADDDSNAIIDLGDPTDSELDRAAQFESGSLSQVISAGKRPEASEPLDSVSESLVHEVSSSAESSFVDLGALPPRKPIGGDSSVIVADVVDSSIFLPTPPSAPLPPNPSSSSINLGADPLADLEGSDLQHPVFVESQKGTEEVISLEEVVLEGPHGEGESPAGIDLPAAQVVPPVVERSPEELDLSDADIYVEQAVSDLPPAGDSGVSLGVGPTSATSSDSAIDLDNILLEQPPANPDAGSSSHRDLIAENLESGVDLLHENKPEESVEEDFFGSLRGPEESSSVDLGSVHNIDVLQESDNGPSKSQPRPDALDALAKTELHRPVEELELEVFESAEQLAMPAARADDETGGDLDALVAAAEQESKSASPATSQADEDDEEVPAPKERRREKAAVASSTGAWLGGTLVGTLIGVAACVAAWFGGLVPAPESGSKPINTPPPITVSPPPVTFAPALERIRNGDLDAVPEDLLARADESKKDELVARAEYYWLNYLRTERGKNPQAVLRADAEPVKRALADLDKAIQLGSADALFLRGQIHEMTGNLNAAREDYQAGAKQFAANPSDKARFESALLVLDLTAKVSRLLPGRPGHLFALLLVALQDPAGPGGVPGGEAPPAGQPANPSLPPEAGHSFWQAVTAARKNDLAAALKALDEAKKRHDQRRYLLPRKPQNPTTDPREEIFLRCCDELREYWLLRSKLNNPDYLTADAPERIPQVDALLQKVGEAARAEQIKELAAKLIKDKPPATPEELIKLIEAERKDAATRLATADETIKAEKKAVADLTSKLKDTTTKLQQTEQTLSKTQATEKQTQMELQASLATLKDVGAALGLPVADPKAARERLLNEVRSVVRTAQLKDPQNTIRTLEMNLKSAQKNLALRWSPEQMLDYWLPLLDSERQRQDLSSRAVEDAGKVLADASSAAEAKAKALLLQGLALRNQDRFHEAVPLLQKAREGLQGSKGDWLTRADAALAECVNPAATLAQRAQQLQATGKPAEALALVDRAVKSTEGNKGPLLLQRARLALEAARTGGGLKAGDARVIAARQDAVAAANEGLFAGHLLAGQISEELGQFAEAEASYRAAMQAAPADDEVSIRSRIALARVLLKQQSEAAPALRPAQPPRSTSQMPTERDREQTALRVLNALLTLTLQPVLPTDKTPTSSEADKLADEILALGDKAPFDARAQALAVKGLHTRALQVYVTGLRDKRVLAPEYANSLLELVNGHPTLKRPESLTPPNPLRAEQFYANGVRAFFAGKFQLAEEQFLAAIENDNGDARSHYYLGLARLAQGKREGQEDLDAGSRLEAQGHPDRAAVSAAFERVQGSLRKVLNQARTRP